MDNNYGHARRPPKGSKEEECQDKTCQEAKKSWKTYMKNQFQSKSNPECPLDREQLGRSTWGLLHTIASKYPLRPTQNDKTEMREFIRIFGNLYPCSYCAEEFRKDLEKMPPRLDSREDLADWFCQIHNRVNEKLNKPIFDCSRVDERWRTGWKDGSCL
jgi:FAD-linked sulfhydryl oxidase